MEKTFVVHASTPKQAQVSVEIAGKKVNALIDQHIAELVPEHGDGTGTLLIAVEPGFEELFTPGAKVTVTIAKYIEPKPAAEFNTEEVDSNA